MSKTIAGVIVGLLLSATSAGAQSKPVGVFDPGTNPPAWASFGTLADFASDDRLRDAAALSRARGFLWVLQLGYHETPTTPIGPHAERVKARLAATGLLPYVIAFSVGEEWYEQWLGGAFAPLGLVPNNPDGTAIIHDWLGRQHLSAKTVLGLPVIWITTIAGPPGAGFRPVPAHTDYVALDPYVPTGGDFGSHVLGPLAYSEQSTTHPLILIPQYFNAPGYAPVTDAMVAAYAAVLARPRYVAMMAFTWQDRPALGMSGLQNLPIRAAVERSLGVK